MKQEVKEFPIGIIKDGTVILKAKDFNGEIFPEISFVAAARMQEKESRFDILRHLFYDGKKKRLWATDRHRLHLCNINIGESDRHFRVVYSKKNEICLNEIKEERQRVPRISAILESHETIAIQDVEIPPKHPEYGYVSLMRLFKKNIIQQKFFNDLAIFSDCWTGHLSYEENAQVFKCENCLAVIMMLDINK